jgi:hypothetical protein
MIHYLNFAIYGMVLMHGIKTGTDIEVPWVAWYFRISAASLAILLAYRIYELSLKNKISVPRLTLVRPRKSNEPKMDMVATSTVPTQPSISTRLRNLPIALLRAQAKMTGIIPTEERVLKPLSIPTNAEASLQTPDDKSVQAAVKETTGQQTPSQAPMEALVPVSESSFSDVKKTVDGSVVTWEGTYQGKPIRVRIFGEPVTKPIPELKESKDAIKQSEQVTLVNRLKNSFEKMTVEPPSAIQRSKHIAFSED